VINPVWTGVETDWKELVNEFDVAVTEADKGGVGGRCRRYLCWNFSSAVSD